MSIGQSASEFARYLGVSLIGQDTNVDRLVPFDKATAGTLSFLNRDILKESVRIPSRSVVVTNQINADALVSQGAAVIPSAYPKFDTAKIANAFLRCKPSATVHSSAFIGPDVELGQSITIGPNCVLIGEIRVGDHCVLGANICLVNKVELGTGTTIRNGTVIGEDAFSLGFGPDGATERFPSFGGVRIGKSVQIGNNSVISRGIYDDTVIEDDVKINDLVHIGNTVWVRKNAWIMAQTDISARVVIGERSWIGQSAAIRQGVKIGCDAMVGMGTVVISNVQNGTTVVGVPGRVRNLGN